jgi:DNA-binding LytR/AlgR family response regulator
MRLKKSILNSYYIIDNSDKLFSSINNVLEDFPVFSSIGRSSCSNEAMNTILKRKPDLVFINLDNVLDNAFHFINELKNYAEILPDFVAVSATKENAYEALKHDFIDYLTLPLAELDLRKLALKFKKKRTTTLNRTLCLKSYQDYRYLNTDEIIFLKADNNTTDFYINDGTVISAFKTLKTFEAVMPKNFFRIHKSYIVNQNYVCRINYSKSKCTVDQTPHKIPFTKTYIDNIDFIKNSLSDLFIASSN